MDASACVEELSVNMSCKDIFVVVSLKPDWL